VRLELLCGFQWKGPHGEYAMLNSSTQITHPSVVPDEEKLKVYIQIVRLLLEVSAIA
jgi:hypothetical protein